MDKYKDFKRHFVSLLGELQEVITYAESSQRVFLRMTAATLEGAYRALLIFDGDVTPAAELLPTEPPKPKKQTKKVPLPKWGFEIDSAKLLEALDAFEKMRKEIKKPLTELARHRLYKNLCELSKDEDTQIAILEQSIFHCWQNVFRLHSVPLSKQKEPTRADKDAEAFEKDMMRRFMEGGA
ncbi:MAG: hypothetical protein VB035_09975 [Candidatus Fimivivens sp.]|nr:hypothetical protein [Candidatus Fimivivens sp.]